jgi:hypothetical protein
MRSVAAIRDLLIDVVRGLGQSGKSAAVRPVCIGRRAGVNDD